MFMFRRRPGWQKLRVVSFAYPLFPVLFILVGTWMTYQGIVLKPYIALATGVTLGTGALVYHLRLRSRTPSEPNRRNILASTRDFASTRCGASASCFKNAALGHRNDLYGSDQHGRAGAELHRALADGSRDSSCAIPTELRCGARV